MTSMPAAGSSPNDPTRLAAGRGDLFFLVFFLFALFAPSEQRPAPVEPSRVKGCPQLLQQCDGR
ncbi:hypothetical protein MSM1_02920 [Mycobacterium sp. SM1]|uniref:hypothetical protein n=1 Tax=Mycobacterium sp. SM1 TaxID=2816243 RepID=UPI001BCD389E|nr:hypothetical protein [Mycobacterium sp. SM1]MBS4727355.1 hypothetical protein [Mycobacterium sp. SM1]